MAFVPSIIDCPDDCDQELLPVAFDDCAPGISASQINAIFIASASAADFNDFSDPVEWAKRLSQDGNVPNLPDNTTPVEDLIRQLTVIADKPAPNTTTVNVSNQRTIDVLDTNTINITVDEFNMTNQDFIASLNCGVKVKLWYQTIGGKLFGGNSGILAQVKLKPVLGRGDSDVATFVGTAIWKTAPTNLEPFVDSPIAAAA